MIDLKKLGFEEWLQRMITYSNLTITPRYFLMLSFFTSLTGALLGYFVFSHLFLQLEKEVVALVSMILGALTPFGYLLFMVDYRKKILEDSMSEALLLIASSLRAGTTLEWAIVSTTKHRFGPIRDELEKTSQELMLGTKIEEALMHIANRTPSRLIKTVVTLWIYGMRAGGNMADLLNSIAFEAKAIQLLRKEIEAQTNTIKTMVIMIVLFLAPAMLALATNYLIVTKSFNDIFKENFKGVRIAGAGANIGQNQMLTAITDPNTGQNIIISDIINFSYALCIISSFTVSGLLGVLTSGDYKAGIRYIPLFLIISVFVYYIVLHQTYGALNDMFTGQLRYTPDGKKVITLTNV